MIDVNEQSKCLASLAVFRELYNKQKDIYMIICEYIKFIIAANGIYQFNLVEMSNLLHTNFDFSIPDAVIATSLKKMDFISRKNKQYYVEQMPRNDDEFILKLQEENQKHTNKIIENLFNYIEENTGKKLDDDERSSIIESFCSFLLEPSSDYKYSKYISAFTIDNQANVDFIEGLNKIREGVILYTGLRYENNINDIGAWRNQLTIFLDTEILFNLGGYNGMLFHTQFMDFYNLVNDINQNGKKRLIKLLFYKEVKQEIEDFFKKAEYIVLGQDRLNPSNDAMKSIINGCKYPSDVVEKKTDFYTVLQKFGIYEDNDTEFYSRTNYSYNFIDVELLQELSREVSFDPMDHLKFLNYIHILRKDRNIYSFSNIGYILLTGNTKTFQVAWHRSVRPENSVPLATSLEWLTDRLWFALNKGFGEGNLPVSFNIISNAQIALSTILSRSIGEKYDHLMYQYNSGAITDEQALSRLVELRNQAKKPEDIDCNDTSFILDSLNEESIEKYIREQEYYKVEAEKKTIENMELQKQLEYKTTQIIEKEQISETEKQRLILEKRESDKRLLIQKQKDFRKFLETKLQLDVYSSNDYLRFKIFIGLLILLIFIVIVAFIKYIGWGVAEPITFVVGLIGSIVLPVIYLLITEKNLNLPEYLKNRKEKIIEKKYKKYKFDLQHYNQLENEITELEKRIE